MMPGWSRQVSQMLTTEIAACCKELKLSRNMVEMADRVQADSHPEYLLKLLRSELEHRETQRKDKFLKMPGFTRLRLSTDSALTKSPYRLLFPRIISGVANLSIPKPTW